ncbi:MAG: PSD1 and planctomycete cytochrome C domain-containing protein [Planctomycetaceae bacterium]
MHRVPRNLRGTHLAVVTGMLWLLTTGFTFAQEVPPATPQDVEFFETKVRPLLVEHCHKCHGPGKQEGGLRLDSRAAVLKGGDSGAAVLPGKVDDSDLLAAIAYDGPLKMPPAGPLPAEAQAILVDWVRRGVPWGHDATTTARQSLAEIRQSHWAFRPLVSPPVPTLDQLPPGQGAWARTDLDRFILSRLHDAGLSPSPAADRRTLYRRASFDLVGLPPDPARLQAFATDPRPTPEAFADVVDELLASPHYGERWGRYWLDLARYADNKGYVFFEEQTYPWGYTYRDWVIRSLNEDLPYDQFVVAQLAADQLPPPERDRHLAALGFITIGGHFVNNVHDIFDDRIDVVSRGLLGLTTTCARCHDHKFDPISQADYYALYGVFRSSTEPAVLPRLPGPIPEREEFEQFEQELAVRQARLNAFLKERQEIVFRSGRERFAEYVLAAHATRDAPSTEDFMLLIPEGDLHPTVLQRYWLHLQKTRRNNDRVWRAWHALAALPETEFGARAGEVLTRLRGDDTDGGTADSRPAHPLVVAALAEPPVTTLAEAANRLGGLLKSIDGKWQQLVQANPAQAPTALPDPLEEELRLVLYGADAPANMPLTTGWGVLTLLPDRNSQGQYQKVLKELEEWMIRAPGAPARAMILQDDPQPYNPRIFLRGNPNRAADAVPRRFLEVLSESDQPFAQGSGRLELARAIASPTNPLTPRVLVNRMWQHHFGAGLVRTPSDFGVRSEPPTHPELLDWLAARFVAQGWSLKQLHRLMMNSAVYQQSATATVVAGGADPQTVDSENRLLWRMNRRRLDFESLRDALLWSAGTLDRTVGGPSIPLLGGPPRRTVYGFIDRLSLPGLLRTFDFPSPDSTSGARDNTTVAPQALFLMNGPFAQQSARQLAALPEITAATTIDGRVQALIRKLFARVPTEEELAIAREFLGNDLAAITPETWGIYAHALLLTNEFVFVD